MSSDTAGVFCRKLVKFTHSTWHFIAGAAVQAKRSLTFLDLKHQPMLSPSHAAPVRTTSFRLPMVTYQSPMGLQLFQVGLHPRVAHDHIALQNFPAPGINLAELGSSITSDACADA